MLELARRVAQVDSTVLITGESGVGKERWRGCIHDESGARGAAVRGHQLRGAARERCSRASCSATRRARSPAPTQRRPGLFEAAHGGTLFLDEVGELPPAMQVKLLRVLQEREVRRVGENKSRAVDVRVLAATNRDLAAEVDGGPLPQGSLLPPARDRAAHAAAARAARRHPAAGARCFLADGRASGWSARCAASRRRRRISSLRYDWPGNVRELENAIERAVALAEGTRIEPEDLPEEVRVALPAAYAPGTVRTLEEIEREYILAALQANGGNRTKTAQQLRIGLATLHRKIKEYEARS